MRGSKEQNSFAMYLGTKNKPYNKLNKVNILEMLQRTQIQASN